MPAVSLTINGRVYEVMCEDSQVDHVRRLAAQLDARAQGLLSSLGTQPEARTLLMLALTLADEMEELKASKQRVEAQLAEAMESETVMAQHVADLSGRIESIAHRMDRS